MRFASCAFISLASLSLVFGWPKRKPKLDLHNWSCATNAHRCVPHDNWSCCGQWLCERNWSALLALEMGHENMAMGYRKRLWGEKGKGVDYPRKVRHNWRQFLTWGPALFHTQFHVHYFISKGLHCRKRIDPGSNPKMSLPFTSLNLTLWRGI